LLTLFTEWSKSFAGLVPDFELMFERFEVLGVLAFLEQHSKDDVMATMSGPAPHNFSWMGRAGWDSGNRNGMRGP
jgi:hypothetical protein